MKHYYDPLGLERYRDKRTPAHEVHSTYLERLCRERNLRQIDENPNDLRAIFHEPTYFRRSDTCQLICPDLFLNYYSSRWTVIELKGSKNKRDKAIHQIDSGIRMLVDVFGVPIRDITGKFVIYSGNHYDYEIIR